MVVEPEPELLMSIALSAPAVSVPLPGRRAQRAIVFAIGIVTLSVLFGPASAELGCAGTSLAVANITLPSVPGTA